MGRRHRARPTEIRDALDEAHKGGFDLPPHGEPPGGASAFQLHDILPANTR
jgi:hypothetical protein